MYTGLAIGNLGSFNELIKVLIGHGATSKIPFSQCALTRYIATQQTKIKSALKNGTSLWEIVIKDCITKT
jgi:hypothetical protein